MVSFFVEVQTDFVARKPVKGKAANGAETSNEVDTTVPRGRYMVTEAIAGYVGEAPATFSAHFTLRIEGKEEIIGRLNGEEFGALEKKKAIIRVV
ncbi:MAG: hypothetical protein HQL42_19275 [Alphaproteobacteria bacterium]|nr:hypothetical protein [Alphaproteobacteria bacterium]